MSRKSNLVRFLPTLLFASVAGFWVYVTSLPVLRDETTTLMALGSVFAVETDDGAVWFRLQGNTARYGIARPDDAVLNMLRASKESGNSLSVRIHLDGARFGIFSNDPEYWVQTVEYLGKSRGNYEPRIRWSWRDIGPGDEGLLRGFAFQESWRAEEAVKALDASIEAHSLDGTRLALAYFTRGAALNWLAYPSGRALNDRDDRLLVRAVDDFRRAAVLDPSDHRALIRQGNATRSLGAYDEALALYEEVERRWPKQYFRAAILRGATYRQLGKFDAALGELDAMVKKHGPQDGMMYHYHRGWTLNELERYPDAVKEFSAGIQSQPDYAWAFVRRACAYAQQGDLEHAIADQKRALEIWDEQLRNLESVPADTRRDRAAIEITLHELESASQSAPGKPNAAPCAEGDSGPAIKRRERSKLFESAGAQTAVELP